MSSEVAASLASYELRAKNLLDRLAQLAEHLHQVAHNPHQIPPDWPTTVTHFRITQGQLEQLQKDIQPVLQYFVLYPVSTPPPQADVPLMLSSRSHVDMEQLETQLETAFWDQADPPEDIPGLVESINASLDRVTLVCEDQAQQTKESLKKYVSPGMEVPQWRQGAAERAQRAFAWLDNVRAGR